MDVALAAGTGLGIQGFGGFVDATGNMVNPTAGTVGVGSSTPTRGFRGNLIDNNQVDPGLAAGVLGMSPSDSRFSGVRSIAAFPESYAPNAFNTAADAIRGLGTSVRDTALESYAQNFPEANLARTSDIVSTDAFGNISINPLALGTQVLDALPGTLMALAPAAVLGPVGFPVGGAIMTVGEVSGEAADIAYQDAITRGLPPAQAQAIADQAAVNAAAPAAATGGLSGYFGGIGGLPGRVATQIGEEAFTEGVAEPTISQAAATTAAGRPLSTSDITGNLNAAIVGGVLGGGIAAVPGGQVAAAPPGVTTGFATPYGGMDTSGIRPGFSPPGFTPGATSPGVTVEGSYTDVTPGYTPSGPTVGQTATTPTGIASAYQQAADTMAEAGVRGVGDVASGTGRTATSMDAMAAVDIINNEIAETGGLSLNTAQNLSQATGLSMQDINLIAGDAPIVGTPTEAAPTDSGPSQAMVDFVNSLSGTPTQNTVAENVAENVETDTGVTVEVQDNVNNQVSNQVTTDTGIVVETTPNTNVSTDVRATDDVIEGTAVEIMGQIPGTTTTNIPTTVNVPTTTNIPATVIYEPDDSDEIAAEVVLEDRAPTGETGGEDVEVDVSPEVDRDQDPGQEVEEPPFECPDGYTAVKLAGRWVCQKTSSAQVGRPTLATQPYLSQSGFAGTNPNPGQTRTVTTTQTVEGS
jgi:hypothetical protein